MTQPRRAIGWLLVAVGILFDAGENIVFINQFLPHKLAAIINPQVILVFIVVGFILVLVRSGDSARDLMEEKPPTDIKVSAGSSTQTASPVIDASQKVEIHNYPASQPLSVDIVPQRDRPSHHVEFRGATRIKTNFEREIYGDEEGLVGVKACFLNRSIVGQENGDFDYAKARIVYRDGSGTELFEVSKPVWLYHDISEFVHIAANCTECFLLAAYRNEWFVPNVVPRPTEYWEDGASQLMMEANPLPLGALTAEVNLVSRGGVALEPVFVSLLLGPNGVVLIKP
jgi:hypothetical protein